MTYLSESVNDNSDLYTSPSNVNKKIFPHPLVASRCGNMCKF